MAKQNTISLPPETREALKAFHLEYNNNIGRVTTFTELTVDVILAGIEALKARK